MENKVEIKRKLVSLCEEYVNNKISVAQEAIDNAQKSANEETRSSAGDKYETGRSMMQLEIEKFSAQLNEGLNLKKTLIQIDFERTYETIQPGSLIYTNNGGFLIAISAGRLLVGQDSFMTISLSSPIGQALYKKKVSDKIGFRNKTYLIKSIA
ncbi:MAG: hypothetical protein V3V16_12365 [Melioribacteraceae bacterium]